MLTKWTSHSAGRAGSISRAQPTAWPASWTPGPTDGDLQAHVTLRVLPDTRVRSFNLKDGRVAIDLFSGTAAQSLAPAAPDPEQDTVQELRRALEQRDALIEQRDVEIEQLRDRLDRLTARFDRLEQAVALSSGELDRVTAGEAGAYAFGRGYVTPATALAIAGGP